LRNIDMTRLPQVAAARAAAAGGAAAAPNSGADPVQAGKDVRGHDVFVAYDRVSGLGWLVFAEIPFEDADALAR
jgi:hypothetical protein